MKAKRRCIPNFEARSVMLFAAIAFGTAMGAHAQTNGSSSQLTVGPTSAQPAQKAAQPPAQTPVFGGTSTQPAAGAKTANSTGVEAAAFSRADKDRDGRLNRAEAVQLPMVSQRFDQIDLNKDNFLSRDEFDKGTKS
jgi:hypothetical protein